MDLFSSYRPPDTTKMTKISSRIHFWGLEGPEMDKIDLNLRFSIKSAFSWRSAPCRILSINHRPGLGPGPRPAKLGLAHPGLARPDLAKLIFGIIWPNYWSCNHLTFILKSSIRFFHGSYIHIADLIENWLQNWQQICSHICSQIPSWIWSQIWWHNWSLIWSQDLWMPKCID